jgi:DNA-binding CsgD family transcriptional regulator
MPTSRQIQCLRLTADGLRAKQIAPKMGVSVATVRGDLMWLYRLLGVINAAQAVELGLREGWLRRGNTKAAK